MIEIESLTYSLNDKEILQNVSLRLFEGKIHGILGPNGSGKSTLLKLLNGLLKPSDGNIIFYGQNSKNLNRRELSKLVAYVPQSPFVSFDFIVEEIVEMGCYAQKDLSYRERQSKIKHVLESVNAMHLLTRNIQSLSGGERQRIYIARALMNDSPILLLDEPTANLDIHHELQIWSLLADLRNDGKTIVIALHDLNNAEKFCDELILLREGKVIAQGKLEDLSFQQYVFETFKVIDNPTQQSRSFILSNKI